MYLIGKTIRFYIVLQTHFNINPRATTCSVPAIMSMFTTAIIGNMDRWTDKPFFQIFRFDINQ